MIWRSLFVAFALAVQTTRGFGVQRRHHHLSTSPRRFDRGRQHHKHAQTSGIDGAENKMQPLKETNTRSSYLRRRNALRRSGIYSKIEDRETLDRLVDSMGEFSVPLDTKVFSQDDQADAMYFVTSGQFECYDENTGEVKAVVGKNDVFGELGVLLQQPRALSVRASTPAAQACRLSSVDIEKYVLGEESLQAEVSVRESARYEEYFEERAKREALTACPVFKELQNDDVQRLVAAMQRMDIGEGERIIEEGTKGGSMYFVADGSFACYRESNQNVVKVCEQGDYFGELGVLFDRPRAVSVRATKASVVFELHGDAFVDSYQKMTAAKYGAASWVLPLAKLIRADKWFGRVLPKKVSNFFQKLPFLAGDLMNRINLLDHYFEEDRWRGTRVHANNMLLSAAIPMYFLSRRASTVSAITKAIMSVGFLGLVADNLICASGKYLGEGKQLKSISKIRYVSHGMTIPLLFIPVIEAGMHSKLFPTTVGQFAMGAAAALSVYEILDWLSFDTNELTLVDNRDSKKHSVRSLAGTLSYTSGKILKCLLPVAGLNLFILAVGLVLAKGRVPAGSWLLTSGLVSFISCAIQRPDIQLYGEPALLALIWRAAESCAP